MLGKGRGGGQHFLTFILAYSLTTDSLTQSHTNMLACLRACLVDDVPSCLFLLLMPLSLSITMLPQQDPQSGKYAEASNRSLKLKPYTLMPTKIPKSQAVVPKSLPKSLEVLLGLFGRSKLLWKVIQAAILDLRVTWSRAFGHRHSGFWGFGFWGSWGVMWEPD